MCPRKRKGKIVYACWFCISACKWCAMDVFSYFFLKKIIITEVLCQKPVTDLGHWWRVWRNMSPNLISVTVTPRNFNFWLWISFWIRLSIIYVFPGIYQVFQGFIINSFWAIQFLEVSRFLFASFEYFIWAPHVLNVLCEFHFSGTFGTKNIFL